MGFYDTVEISASGLSAERMAMDVIANNIANINTTRTPQGGAFKRQLVVFSQTPSAPDATPGIGAMDGSDATNATDDSDLSNPFDPQKTSQAQVEGVQVVGIVNDPSPDKLVFDPGNPEADARGYVHYPNVELVKEMVDMMAASRAYEANVSVIQESRTMDSAAAGLLKS